FDLGPGPVDRAKDCGAGWSGRANADQTGNFTLERLIAQPVDLCNWYNACGKGRFRTHDDLPRFRIEAYDVKRFTQTADTKAAALTDSIVNNAVMTSQGIPVGIHDLAGISGAGPQFFDHACIITVRHEADILTVR